MRRGEQSCLRVTMLLPRRTAVLRGRARRRLGIAKHAVRIMEVRARITKARSGITKVAIGITKRITLVRRDCISVMRVGTFAMRGLAPAAAPVAASGFYRSRARSRRIWIDPIKFTSPRADGDQRVQPDAVFYARGYFPPMSNTERQRRFRRDHPGYYQRLHAKRRAQERAALAAMASATETMAEKALPAMPVRLALPAPVEPIVIPGMNTIGEMRAAMFVPIPRKAA